MKLSYLFRHLVHIPKCGFPYHAVHGWTVYTGPGYDSGGGTQRDTEVTSRSGEGLLQILQEGLQGKGGVVSRCTLIELSYPPNKGHMYM